MSAVERSWGQWAADSFHGAVESAHHAADTVAESAIETAEAAKESVEFAVDYWESHSPETVTKNFRDALDERVSQHLGASAGDAARVLSAPVSAAARFAVQGAQGVDSLRQQATDVIQGRSPMPSPVEVTAGAAVGAASAALTTAQNLDSAVARGFDAVAEADAEATAAAAEDAFKVGYDVGTLVVAARGGVAGAGKFRASVGPGFSGGGATALQGAFNPALAAKGAVQLGASTGGLAVLGPRSTPRPIENRNTRVKSGRANEFPRKTLRGVSIKWLKKNKPRGWKTVTTRENEGFIWVDPQGTERLRFMRPNGKNAVASKWTRQENGCFRWKNAEKQFLDIDGNVVPKTDPDYAAKTHIDYEGPL